MPHTLNVPVSAVRIGPFAMATNAEELFVEWGISVDTSVDLLQELWKKDGGR